MQIYVHRNNQQLGPFTEAEVKAQLASGALSLQDHVWWQGQATWVPLGQSPFATGLPPVPPRVAVPGAGPHYLPSERTSNLALWSMICGIATFFCVITFIPAIILGHMGLSEIRKNPAIQGRGLALTGLIIGYGFLALYIVSIIAMGVLMALGNQVQRTFKTISAQVQSAQDDSDQSTNSTDQSTNNAPTSGNSSDSNTNSTPVITP